jgi:transcriptional regulator with XRE-family HTH domain
MQSKKGIKQRAGGSRRGWELVMSMLKQQLREQGLTQTEVAQRMRVTPATVTGWVNGVFEPSPQRYHQLAAFLGLPSTKALIAIIDGTKKKRVA